jgi:hypothetical protein
MNKVVSKQVTNILKNLFFFLILFTISSSCDAILMLPYVIKNKTQDTLTIQAPSDLDIFSMRNTDSVYHLAPNQNLLVGWNRGVGFPWETKKLFRKNRADGEIHGEFSNTQMKNLDGRIGVWTSDDGVLGRPYVSLLDTIQRGLGDRILFFPYEEWTNQPNKWFKALYDFIGEEYYQHDFDNIEQTIRENDAGYGWGSDLHEIKTGKLRPAASEAYQIIGRDWATKLHDTEFWKKKNEKKSII